MCRRASAPLGPQPQEPAIQVQKPSLTRKLVGSPRINLNQYWNVFEAMMDPSSTNAENENIDNERRMAGLNLGNNRFTTVNFASSTTITTPYNGKPS